MSLRAEFTKRGNLSHRLGDYFGEKLPRNDEVITFFYQCLKFNIFHIQLQTFPSIPLVHFKSVEQVNFWGQIGF